MDAPSELPAQDSVLIVTDAYQQFWDCVESDAPASDELPPPVAESTDAYRQFWEMNEF